jgi:hypothetical protein
MNTCSYIIIISGDFSGGKIKAKDIDENCLKSILG